MATTVRELLTSWGFEVDDSQLDQLNRAVDAAKEKVTSFGDRLGSLSEGLTRYGKRLTAAVTLPLIAAGSGFLKLASDAEEIQGKFRVVFGALNEDTKWIAARQEEWVTGIHDQLGRSRTDLRNWSAGFQDTFVPFGFARDNAADMSKKVTQLGLDLASFYNMAESDVMQTLQSTLVGNTEGARKFGVVITENTLKAELLRMNARKVNGAYTEQDKLVARLNLLYAGTADAQGDALRTQDSFANRMRRSISLGKELGETFGNDLIPFANRLLDQLQRLTGWLQALTPEARRIIIVVAAAAAALGPLLLIFGAFAGAASKIVMFIGLLKKLSIGLRLAGLSALWAQVQMLLIPIAIIAILALIGYLVYRYWDQIKPVLVKIGVWLKAAYEKTKSFIAKYYPILLVMLLGPIGIVLAMLIRNRDKVKAFFVSAYARAKAFVTTNWSTIKTVMGVALLALLGPVGVAIGILIKYWDQISAAVSWAWQYVGPALTALIELWMWIAGVLWRLFSFVATLIYAYLKNYWNKLHFAFSVMWALIKRLAAWIWEAAQPVIAKLRPYLVKLKRGFDIFMKNAKEKIESFRKVFSTIIDKIRTRLAELYTKLPAPLKAFITWLATGEGKPPSIPDTSLFSKPPEQLITGGKPAPGAAERQAAAAGMTVDGRQNNKVDVTQIFHLGQGKPEDVGAAALGGVTDALGELNPTDLGELIDTSEASQ